MTGLVLWLDALGVVAFATTGAFAASRRELDIFGFIVLATLTGIGGGTLRDLLLGRDPVFWIAKPWPLYLTALTGGIVFFTAHLVERRYRVIVWLDAVGLALYAVLGADIALAAGSSAIVAIVMGVLTAVFGGILRDIVCAETPLILRREIYASAAVVGAAAFAGLTALGMPAEAAGVASFSLAFATRGAGLLFKLSLPPYRPRPGRPYPPDAPL